jgi:hypothetical protein
MGTSGYKRTPRLRTLCVVFVLLALAFVSGCASTSTPSKQRPLPTGTPLLPGVYRLPSSPARLLLTQPGVVLTRLGD